MHRTRLHHGQPEAVGTVLRTLLTSTSTLVLLLTLSGSAGAAPAISDFEGDVAFGSGGTLTLELFGTLPGTDHDQVNVAATADLDGALSLLPSGGFVPAVGDSFTLLTWGSRVGEFASVVGVQQAGNVDLALRYDAGAAVVATVQRGDVDGDGFLTTADTAIVNANQGLATTAYTAGDVNGDGDVDATDAAIVQDAVGNAAAVPDLSGPALVLLSCLLLAAGARRLHRS